VTVPDVLPFAASPSRTGPAGTLDEMTSPVTTRHRRLVCRKHASAPRRSWRPRSSGSLQLLRHTHAGLSPHGCDRRAVGRVVDPETGLIYLRSRYYDPSTSQMLTRDPLVTETRSAYAYAGDDPLTGSDPSGLSAGIRGPAIAVKGCVRDPTSCEGTIGIGSAVSSLVDSIKSSLGICSIVTDPGCVSFGQQHPTILQVTSVVTAGVGFALTVAGMATANPTLLSMGLLASSISDLASWGLAIDQCNSSSASQRANCGIDLYVATMGALSLYNPFVGDNGYIFAIWARANELFNTLLATLSGLGSGSSNSGRTLNGASPCR